MKYIHEIMNFAENRKIYPDICVIDGSADAEVMVDGKILLMFSSNNYPGLTSHPLVRSAAHEAIERFGTGSGGCMITVSTVHASDGLLSQEINPESDSR
jgi:7-keto-8-aminopelargonate synthetase-like enzyme